MTKQDIINLNYRAANIALEAEEFRSSPHVVLRARVFPDGGMWCALYGEDLQNGVAGFGATPALACADFDNNWRTSNLTTPEPGHD